MKIARFSNADRVSYGVVEGESIRSIAGQPWEVIEYTGEVLPLANVHLLAPVDPSNVFAIGRNYKEHAAEQNAPLPKAPQIFLKASSSVLAPGQNILLPAMAPNAVDYEAELVVVIGHECHRVSKEKALDYVLGYTCGNDVSARDAQLIEDTQWARGKSFDTFCPLGPWIETELDPNACDISMRLNGEIMQASNTSQMIFPVEYLVSYVSQVATLKPGTVIMTGTPSGVGHARTPEVYLKPGDRVEVCISGIGCLENGVAAEV